MSKKKKVLLIGWDAADWNAINPLMDAGLMPTLEKLVNNGVMGNLATLDPPLSPTLWTSIATGKRPYNHGVLGFTEPDPSGNSVRPVHITSRKVRAIWNILCHKGYKCHQVGWWPSHPAEPINGTYISNFYQRANKPITEPWDMLEGTVHPADKSDLFATIRLHPDELTATHLQPFLPNIIKFDHNNPKIKARIQSLSKIIADCTTIHSATTYILDKEEWDFMAVYYDAIDHFGHGFMKYNPPRRPHIDPDEFELYKDVVTSGYRYHDMMLETLIKSVPKDTTIILVSDHGFHPHHLRPTQIPREPAGPAWEHSPYGIIVASGPGIKKDQQIYGASLLDVTPTVLSILDLPIGRDMDGKVLIDIFESRKKVDTIESWDTVEGNFYTHADDFEEDPESSQKALQQLVDLGYIAPLSPNAEENIKSTIRDNNFFKARSLIDGGKYSEAIELLEELHRDEPEKEHYAVRLANAYLQLKKTSSAREIVQSLRSYMEDNTITLLVLQARVSLQEGNLEKAQRYVHQALMMNENHPGLIYYDADISFRLEKYDEAIDKFAKAISKNPNNELAHHMLGKSYAAINQHEKAVDAYLESIGLKFFAPDVHYDLALSLEKLEIWKDAAQAYKTSLHIMPKNEKAKRRLLYLCAEKLNLPQEANIIRSMLPDESLPEITIVSGLPRSGTSMLMQMLDAGGMDIFTDGLRAADENNPRGYFEHEKVKYLQTDQSFLKGAAGKALKIVAPLLFNLPADYRYKILFMERELGEILLSQHKMLKRDQKKGKNEKFSFELWKKYEEIINKVKTQFRGNPNLKIKYLKHADFFKYPEETARDIQKFLGMEMDTKAMSKVVDPSLYREQENALTTNSK